MKFQQKLSDRLYRWALIRFVFSLCLAVILLYTWYQTWNFVQIGQELSEKFKRSHSHIYEEEDPSQQSPKETPYYGCDCVMLNQRLICENCVVGNQSHILMDTPEVTFQRCYNQMLVEVCPTYAVDNSTLLAILCHRSVETGMRAVIYSQERILSASFFIIASLLYFGYLYFIVYQAFHRFLEESSSCAFRIKQTDSRPKLSLNNGKEHAKSKYT